MARHDYVEIDELGWSSIAGEEVADWNVLSAVARQLKPMGFEVLVRRYVDPRRSEEEG